MSVLVHDIIKVNYTTMGYLPDYPHHLISDREMIYAFLHKTDNYNDELLADETITPDYIMNNYEGYMVDQYVYPMLKNLDGYKSRDFDKYDDAVLSCLDNMLQFMSDSCDTAYNTILEGNFDDTIELFPDWIYSYMLGSVIGPKSDQKDKHDLFVLMDTDNLYDQFNTECAYMCLDISKQWLRKFVYNDNYYRPSTCFGEPHVLKSLRLTSVG